MNEDNNKPKENLNEVYIPKLSWAGKLFFGSVAAYLGLKAYKGYQNENIADELGMSDSENPNEVGNIQIPKLPIKIKGTPQQIQAIIDTIKASVEFQQEINNPDATIESVIQKLNAKNNFKADFEAKTGFAWPL
jgi:hypothetical protein